MQVLVTNRLTLRPPLEVDAEILAHHLSDERVTRHLTGVPLNYTMADAQEWISGKVEDHSDGLTFTIHRNRLIGAVGVRKEGAGYSLGYWLAPDHWGQGLMSEAVRAVVACAFRQLGIDELSARVFIDNPSSQRVLEKLGFVVVGPETLTSRARGADVRAQRMSLSRCAFEQRFGVLDDSQAA